MVRYNGGAQAGHNVVTPDGRHHTFSQFGSASFVPGVHSLLSRFVVIHPSGFLREGDLLYAQGLSDIYSRTHISDQALIITPFHQAANHLRELLRGPTRHGSCGIGVGEAVEDSKNASGVSVHTADLLDVSTLTDKIEMLRLQKLDEMGGLLHGAALTPALLREWKVLEDPQVVSEWIAQITRLRELGIIVPDAEIEQRISTSEMAIFEGAQGILLDADAGFHPYTTWSNCTDANARQLISQTNTAFEILRIGILRTYAVRHGPGPLPTEQTVLAPLISEHNQTNDWQGQVRYGYFDAVLARYALSVNGGVDQLALTHCDFLTKIPDWQVCTSYRIEENKIEILPLHRDLSITKREEITNSLLSAFPEYLNIPGNFASVSNKITSLTGTPIGYYSQGQTSDDVIG